MVQGSCERIARDAPFVDEQRPSDGWNIIQVFGPSAKSYRQEMRVDWEARPKNQQHPVLNHDRLDKQRMWYEKNHYGWQLPGDFFINHRQRTQEKKQELERRLREKQGNRNEQWELMLSHAEYISLVDELVKWCPLKSHKEHFGGMDLSRGHAVQRSRSYTTSMISHLASHSMVETTALEYGHMNTHT